MSEQYDTITHERPLSCVVEQSNVDTEYTFSLTTFQETFLQMRYGYLWRFYNVNVILKVTLNLNIIYNY